MSTASQHPTPIGHSTATAWSAALADVGGRNSLIWGTRPGLALDLVAAHPGGVAKLLSGQPVLLTDLVRAPGPRERALGVVSAIADRAQEMEEDWGLTTCFVTSGIASWDVPGTQAPAAPVVLRPARVTFTDTSRTEVEIALTGVPEVNPALLRFLRVSHGVDLDSVVLAEMVDRLHARTDEPLLRHLEMLCRAVPGFAVRSGQYLASVTYSKDAGIADLSEVAAAPSRALDLLASAAAGRSSGAVAPHLPQVAGVSRNVVCPLDTMGLRIVDLVAAGQDVLVEARPGTGRTSLRSALVADAVAREETVLLAAADESIRRQVGAVIDNWVGADVPAAWDVARTRQEQDEQHAALVAGLEQVIGGGLTPPGRTAEPSREALDSALAAHLDHSAMVHEKRHPWGVSVHDLHQRLAALASLPQAPSIVVPLEDEVVQRVSVADLPAVQQDIVDLAARGAWEVRSQEDPWFGVHAEDEEDAGRLLAVAERLGGGVLQRTRDELEPIARALGVPQAGSLNEGQRLLRLARAVRLAMRRFGADVFEQDLDAWAAAHGRHSPVSVGSLQAGRIRTRVRKHLQARGTEPEEGVAEAVAQAAAAWHRLAGWRGRDAHAAVEPVGTELTEVAERFETVFTDVVWFQNHLSDSSGDDLLATDLEALQTRMERLAARPDRAQLLPEVSPRWRELTGRGFGTVLRELARRSVPVERVAAEVEHIWVRAVLEAIGRSEPALAQFDREAALASVAELDRAVTASHTAAREAVAETVHRARTSVGRTRRAAALLEAARRDGPWSMAEWWRRAPDVMRALTPVVLASPWTVADALPPTARLDLGLVDDLTNLAPARVAGVLGRVQSFVGFGDPETQEVTEPEPSTPGRPVGIVPGESAWTVLTRRVPQLGLTTSWRPLSADLEPPVPGRTPLAAVPGLAPQARHRRVVEQEAVPQVVWELVRGALARPSGTQSVLVTPPTEAEASWWRHRLTQHLAGDHYSPGVRGNVVVRSWRRARRTTADVVVVLADGHGDLLGDAVAQPGSQTAVLPVLRRARRSMELVVTRASDQELRAARSVPDSAGGLLTRWFDAPPVADKAVGEGALPPLHARFVRRLRAEGLVARPVHHQLLGWLLHLAPGPGRPEITTVVFDDPISREGIEVDAHVRVWPEQLRRAGWMVEPVSSLDLHRDLGREAMRVRNSVLRAAAQQAGRRP
ncbi:hypothetical protein [Kytococcus sedentarius]|uniref:hypothetical protein n=1 Tax=Kytococcus sedentarius TaxID=1276 RepID=UPI0035BBCBDC